MNSALQRARATVASRDREVVELSATTTDRASEELLARYLDAFERYDMDALTALLHEDATQSMPPDPMWLRGRDEVLACWFGPGAGCAGSKLVPVEVNGLPGFAQYRDGGDTPWAIQVPVWRDGLIVDVTAFLETDGSLFGLPRKFEA